MNYDNAKLATVLQNIRECTELPIVIFDLDSTLFSTAPRNLRIMREFASDCQDPQLQEAAARISLSELGWSFKEPLIKHGVSQDSPALDDLQAYWETHFFTDDYVRLDLPTRGAAEFARRCHEAGALLYYLTGRHVRSYEVKNIETAGAGSKKRTVKRVEHPGMEIGTVLALTERGFPFWEGRCELHLKARFEDDDSAFKNAAVTYVKSLGGKVIASFDNEPGNVVVFKTSFPSSEGTLNFFLDTVHSPEGTEIKEKQLDTDPSVLTIADFVLP